jgi:hypothetical protein
MSNELKKINSDVQKNYVWFFHTWFNNLNNSNNLLMQKQTQQLQPVVESNKNKNNILL